MRQKLLLLHGALANADSLKPLAEILQKDFEIHLFDFEGHGGMPAEGALSIMGFANQVRTYLAQHHIDQTAIFGYSMGGYVGLYLARHYPGLVPQIFTLATKIDWTIEGADKEAALLHPAIIKEKVPKYAAALAQMHGEDWEIVVGQTAEMMRGLGNDPVLTLTDFEQIQTPVLLAVGDKDAMVTMEETLQAYRKLPLGQMLVLPGTKHPIEKADTLAVAQHIRSFLLTSAP